jgi:hypothetical protein
VNQGDLYEIGIRAYIEAQHARRETPVPAWLSTRVKISGSLDRYFAWSDLAIRIYSLSTETIDLKRQTLQVTYDSNGLNIRKIQDRAPLDIQVAYDTTSKDLSFQFIAEHFQPASLFQLTGSLKRFSPYLLSSVSSTGSVAVNLDELRLRYSADLQIELPEEVLPFDGSVLGRITGNEEIMYLSPLVFDTSRGRVEFLGNVLVKNLMPAGLLRINDFELLEGQNLNATLNIERGVQAVSIEGRALNLGETLFESFTLSLAPEGRSVGFTVSAVLEVAPESGSLEATGDFSWAAEPSTRSTGCSFRNNGYPHDSNSGFAGTWFPWLPGWRRIFLISPCPPSRLRSSRKINRTIPSASPGFSPAMLWRSQISVPSGRDTSCGVT